MEVSVLIPFIDLRERDRRQAKEIQSALAQVIESGTYVGGEFVERFESEFSKFIGCKHSIGVGNGLDALRLILQGLKIGPGDEVLVPAQTFIATWLAVAQTGATPIGIDIDFQTGNLDPMLVPDKINSRTAAIIAVHLHGRPADLVALKQICDQYGIALIEDAAQAHGAELLGTKIGNWGRAAAFSFYPTKNLGGMGDAGIVTTSDSELAAEIQSLRSYGSEIGNKYSHTRPGWNSRMDPIQAAVLSVFLPRLEEWNTERQKVAREYLRHLREITNLTSIESIQVESGTVWHHFVVQSLDRDQLRGHLLDLGIQSDIHYPIPPAFSDVFAPNLQSKKRATNEFPEALWHSQQSLSLPIHPWMNDQSPIVGEKLLVAASLLPNRR